ncbi:alpha/beta-Hydrolases superfamily protein [Citrus sinensis]|nr:alpha/beta-Hydrolases superfamily protein [Citrus sinensis]
MLVAAIMDVVTSNCDGLEKVCFKPALPGNAETRDIADVIEVIEEGGMHFDEPQRDEDDDDGGRGMRGIGIKILEGTTVLGLSRTSRLMKLGDTDDVGVESDRPTPKTLALLNKHDSSSSQALSSAVVPGANRSRIQELDQDGHAVMTGLMALERSVKWHGSLVARLLLEARDLPLNDSVSDWSSSLLSTVYQASKNYDIPLAWVALSAFLVSIERSPRAQEVVMDKGLQLIRDAAKRTTKHIEVQETLAKVLDMISTGDMRLSLEESQKWSGILLPWVFGKSSSDNARYSAIKILSCNLEDHGPSSIPISKGWLAVTLNEILGSSKTASAKRSPQPKNDKVKTQIDQSNILFAAQTANQLAGAVVNLAGKQLVTTTDETFPLLDLLFLEPTIKESQERYCI